MVGTAVNQRGQLSPSSSCLLPCGTGPQCGLVFGSRKSGFLRERSYLFLLAPNLVVLSFLLLAFWRHDAGWLYMDTTWGEHVGGSPVLGAAADQPGLESSIAHFVALWPWASSWSCPFVSVSSPIK